jgi:hypothetical protein
MGLNTLIINDMKEDRIINIETYRYHGDTINFAGTMRNERKFEMFQDVFIMHKDMMVKCKVVGIELPPRDNPEYIYKIELPEGFIEDRELRVSLICEHIFSSIDEAKESAFKMLNTNYELNKNNIEKFFKQYENGNTRD